jgi:hypothetical protein
MRSPLLITITLLGALASLLGLAHAAPPPPATVDAAFFEQKVRPILAANCLSCHSGKAGLSGLRLDSREHLLKGGKRGPAVLTGKPEESLLLKAVHYDAALKMPPAGRLPDASIEILIQWVKAGSPWARVGGPTVGRQVSPSRAPAVSPSQWWSFRPLRTPRVPTVRTPLPPKLGGRGGRFANRKSQIVNPIDAFVLAELPKHGLKPNPPADARTLIRRVTLDLTGLPPTPEEVDEFVNECRADGVFRSSGVQVLGTRSRPKPDPNTRIPEYRGIRTSADPPVSEKAYERLVNRLLQSPHYGERLALPWLDLGRYADSDGYHDDTDRTQWGYRDYVIRAFNQDKPFDQFTIEQLAGDLLAKEKESNPDPRAASADPGTADTCSPSGQRQLPLSRSAGRVPAGRGRGVRAHPLTRSPTQASQPPGTPFDPREAVVASAFNRNGPTSSEGGAIIEEYLAKYAVDRVNTTTNVWLGLTVQCSECHDHKYDPITQKDFYSLFAFFNQVPEEILYRGADAPPTIPMPTPQQQAKLDELARQISDLETSLKSCSPDAKPDLQKKLDAAKKSRTDLDKQARLRIMADLPQRRPTHVLLRGDYRGHGPEVQPAVPAALGTLPDGAKHDRLALARWIVSPENPLTPRVTVNRLWQMLFGAGLVRTSEDFGTRGELPSHPELLDRLASAFVGTASSPGVDGEIEGPRDRGTPAAKTVQTRREGADREVSPSLRLSVSPSSPKEVPTTGAAPATGYDCGWSVKKLLKLIVMSATYRQSARATPEQLRKDPENRWLGRGARFRLPAELIRDNALAISGLLVPKIGGPSVKPYQPGDLWRELSAGDQEAKSYVQDHGPDLYRRGIYTFWKRSILYPAFAVFDAPKREVCVTRRLQTNTPLAAFATMNDTAYVEAARVFAQRILANGGPSTVSRLDYAYRVALARPPAAKEAQVLVRLHDRMLAKYRLDLDAAKKLVAVGEAPRPAELDPAEHAAWTCVCNAILNLDETITRE